MRRSSVQSRGTRVFVALVAAALAVAVIISVGTLGAQTLPAPLQLTATAGQPFTGTVATFTSTSCGRGCAATINWGDGTTPAPPGQPLPGTAKANGNGGIDITGTHTYAAGGSYTITVMLQTCTGCSPKPAPKQATAAMTVATPPPVTTTTTVPQTPTGPTTPAAANAPEPTLQFKARTVMRKRKTRASRTIDFTMPTAAGAGRAIDHFLWDFGDGHVANRNVGGLLYPGKEQPTANDQVTHQYASNGVFHVTAHAVDNTGADTAVSTNVVVGCVYTFSGGADAGGSGCQNPAAQSIFPLYLKYQDDPIVNQTVEFTLPAAQTFKATAADAILKIVGHDLNGNPIYGAPIGASKPGSTPDVTLPNFTIDFGDGTVVQDNGPDYPLDGFYDHPYSQPGVYLVTATELLGTQTAVFSGHVHVENGNACDQGFSINGFATTSEGGGCFRRHHVGNGTATDPLDPSVTDGPQYALIAQDPAQRVDAGGLAFSGTSTSGLTFDPFTGAVAGSKGLDVNAGGQLVYSGGPITLAGDTVQLPVQNALARVDGLPIASGTGTIDIPQQGDATITGTQFVLPPDLKSATTPAPDLSPGQIADPGQDEGLSFELPGNLGFGPVQIQGGTITHSGGIWTGTANIVLFQAAIGGSLSFDSSGNLAGAAVNYQGPPSIPVAGPVEIDGVNAGITLENGAQAFSFYGSPVDLSIAGVVKVHGCMSFAYVNTGEHATLPCNGNQVATAGGVYVGAGGSVDLLGFSLGSGGFQAFPGGISANGHFEESLPLGLASVSGDVMVSITPPTFLGTAGAEVKIAGYSGGSGYVGVNQNGAVACINFPNPIYDFWVGAWVRWNPLDGGITSGDDSCNVAAVVAEKLSSAPASTERLASGHVAEAGLNGITIPAGAPYDVIEVTGKDHSPLVNVTPPKGTPIVDTGAAVQLISKNLLIIHADATGDAPGLINPKMTSILIRHATPGFWHIAAQSGSSKITRVSRLAGVAKPKVTANVTATAQSRRQTVHWKLRKILGQRVTFVEHAAGIDHRIGSTSATSGTLHFSPADGPAGHRDIVAQVTQDGFPRTTLTVAGFDAPAPVVLTAPKIKARVHGGKLNVSWTRVRGASLYSVDVQLSDGRRLHPTVKAGVLHLRVKHVRRGTGITVSVTPLTASASAGTAGTVAVKARVKKAKPIKL